MERLLASDLLLLSWNDETGRAHRRTSSGLAAGVGGALLLDAVLAHAVTIEDGRVRATGRAAEDPQVDSLVADVVRRRRPPKAKTVVSGLGNGRRLRAVRDRMVEDGVLGRDESRILGIFPITRRRPVDPREVATLRARIRDLLVGAADPERVDDRDVILASLAGSTGALELLVPRGDRKQAKRRAEAFRDGTGVSEAVHDAIREAQAAVVAGAAAAAVAGGGSG